VQPAAYEQWKSGHFHRELPAGYAEGLERDRNDILDPAIHAYYAKIRNVTRGPLWRADRWRDIWDLNIRQRCLSR
jgi:arabinofuranosyltransferase